MAIHDRDGRPHDHELDNPFYLFCDGLPIAVKQGVAEALAFRDSWEPLASNEEKAAYRYHPTLRNWVGGPEDSIALVEEAKSAWSAEG